MENKIVINKKRENSIYKLKRFAEEDVQTELAISLANFFNVKDLENISEMMLQTNVTTKRDISEEEVIILHYIKSENKSQFVIKDILLLDQYPPVRFIEVITRLSPIIDYNRFRYYYYPNIYNIINKVIGDAYNYVTYAKPSLTTYTVNKALLYKNFSREVADILRQEKNAFEEFKYVVCYILMHNIFNMKDRFIKIFNVTHNISVEITTITDDMIKIGINNLSERKYLYIDRHIKGFGQLRLIYELVLYELYPIGSA